MHYNIQEAEVASKLKELKKKKVKVVLSLYPSGDLTMIQETNNTMYINEGQEGTYHNISEAFYDQMVLTYIIQ